MIMCAKPPTQAPKGESQPAVATTANLVFANLTATCPFTSPPRGTGTVGGEEWPYSPDISTASCPGLCNVNFNCDSSRIHTCHFGPKAGELRDCPETSTALDHHRTCGALSRVKADDFVSDFGLDLLPLEFCLLGLVLLPSLCLALVELPMGLETYLMA